MKAINAERDRNVHSLWRLGYTIDEISFETRIPRSTVGYYTNKFKEYRMKGRPIVFTKSEEDSQQMSQLYSLMAKGLFLQRFLDILKEGDYEKAY